MQTKHLCVLIHIRSHGEVGASWNWFKPSSKIFWLTVPTCPRRYFFCGSLVLLMSCVCQAFASVPGCLVVTWRERAGLLALVYVVYFDFVTFPFGILGHVWYLSVSIPEPCCLPYLVRKKAKISNQVPHLSRDTKWESDKTQESITRTRELWAQPFPSRW